MPRAKPKEDGWLEKVYKDIGEPDGDTDPQRMTLKIILRMLAREHHNRDCRTFFLDRLEEIATKMIEQGNEEHALLIFRVLLNVDLTSKKVDAHFLHFWKRGIFAHPPFSLQKEYLPELGSELFRITCLSIPTPGHPKADYFDRIISQLDVYYRETPEVHQDALARLLHERMATYRMSGYKAALMILDPGTGLYMEFMYGWIRNVEFSKMKALVRTYENL